MNIGNIIDGTKIYFNICFGIGTPRLDYLHIDITNRCNLKCNMCEWRYKIPEPKDMDYMLFTKIVDEGLKIGLKKVVFSATGEATIHKDFHKMVEYVNKRGLSTELVTNLTIPNSGIKNIDYVIISIDGTNKTTYERIRVGANFDSVMQNLRNLLEINKNVSINFVVQKSNFSEINNAYKLFIEEMGVKSVSFKFIHDTFGDKEDLKLNYKELRECIDSIRGLKSKKVSTNTDLSSVENIFNGKFKNYIHKIPCYNLFVGAYINPEGLVFPCCNFYREGDILGDVKTNTLKEIWMSKNYKNIRNKFKGVKPKVCEGCPGDNLRIHKLLSKIPLYNVLV